MTNKVESDNSRIKLMQTLNNLEDLMATELGNSTYKSRSNQKVLEKYKEVACNDSHWKALELFDDFIID